MRQSVAAQPTSRLNGSFPLLPSKCCLRKFGDSAQQPLSTLHSNGAFHSNLNSRSASIRHCKLTTGSGTVLLCYAMIILSAVIYREFGPRPAYSIIDS